MTLAAVLAATASSAAATEATEPEAGERVWLLEWNGDSQPSLLQGDNVEVRREYGRLWDGVSISATEAEARHLERNSAVERVWPDIEIPVPRLEAVEESAQREEMGQAVDATGAAEAHRRGIAGEDVKVGVIDTGIDYEHPDLGGCFGYGCRVAHGYDFVGDDYRSDKGDRRPQPDRDPMDCNGHGTHVAGIVGANGEVVGAAPNVGLGAYRVFGCEGATSSEIILDAMERAADDGMDVVNMSLGYAFQWPEYPTAVAASEMVDEGIVMVASAGNAGTTGAFSLGAPSVGENVISVASLDNRETRMSSAQTQPFDKEIGWGPLDEAKAPEIGYHSDDLEFLGRACDAVELSDPDNTAALVERGDCTFADKYDNAVAAGASAVVIYNNNDGPFSAGGVDEGDVPGAVIPGEAGDYLRDLIDLELNPSIEFGDDTVAVDLPHAGLASSFSSIGPAPDLSAKPDVAAPGGGIWSTWVRDKADYKSVSGTSMSAPHVAGAAALLLGEDPSMDPAEVRRRLSASASPVPWRENSEVPLWESVHRVGAGLIDIPAALDATVVLRPVVMGTGDGTGERVFEFEASNVGDEALDLDMEHQLAAATDGDIRDIDWNAVDPDIAFEPKSLQLDAGASRSVEVTWRPGENMPDHSVFGGYVVASDGAEEWRLPYSGYFGDFNSLSILDHKTYPRLVVADDDGDLTEPWKGDRVLQRGDPLPGLQAFLAYQTRTSLVEVVNADTGTVVDSLEQEFMPRSPGVDDTLILDLAEVVDRSLRVGEWQVRLSVVRPGGDPDSASDWETWTSPSFQVTR